MKSIVLLVSLSGILGATSWRDDLEQAGRLRGLGESVAAEELYHRVLEEAKGLNAAQLNAMGMELAHQSRWADAEQVYRQSLAAWDRLGSQTAPSRSITAGNLAVLLETAGRHAEAEPLLLDQLRQAEAGGRATGAVAARAAALLAALYQAWGQPEKAESFAVRADKGLSASDGERESRAANRRILAAILLDERRYPEAEDLLRGLIQDLPERARVGVYNDLAMAETQQGQLAEAETWALQAVTQARQLLPAGHPM